MFLSAKRTETFGGVTIPRRRFTRWAAIYFLGYFVAPFLLICFLVDLLLYLLVTDVLGGCYAILCWFD